MVRPLSLCVSPLSTCPISKFDTLDFDRGASALEICLNSQLIQVELSTEISEVFWVYIEKKGELETSCYCLRDELWSHAVPQVGVVSEISASHC